MLRGSKRDAAAYAIKRRMVVWLWMRNYVEGTQERRSCVCYKASHGRMIVDEEFCWGEARETQAETADLRTEIRNRIRTRNCDHIMRSAKTLSIVTAALSFSFFLSFFPFPDTKQGTCHMWAVKIQKMTIHIWSLFVVHCAAFKRVFVSLTKEITLRLKLS
jgi:hypothetical protein